jgi:hypothetical protein
VAAVLVVAAAAVTDRRWLVPFGVVLAMPVLWLNSLAVLAACLPLAFPAVLASPRDRRHMRQTDASVRPTNGVTPAVSGGTK